MIELLSNFSRLDLTFRPFFSSPRVPINRDFTRLFLRPVSRSALRKHERDKSGTAWHERGRLAIPLAIFPKLR